jgi:hypothetical protein
MVLITLPILKEKNVGRRINFWIISKLKNFVSAKIKEIFIL